MKNEELIINELQSELSLEGIKVISLDDLEKKWASHFNYLIQNDFSGMLNLFYRIDISEDKLRRVLRENPDENAGKLITTLVIERLLQKLRSRKEFQSRSESFSNDSDEEKW